LGNIAEVAIDLASQQS